MNDAKIDPRVFISLGSIALWAGGRPRLFKRLLKRGDLRPAFRTVSALVWTAWASVEPHSLRAFLRLLLVARSARASGKVQTDGPVRWTAAALRSAKGVSGGVAGDAETRTAPGES